MEKTHRPFGMDEGVHKMCEELFDNRYFKSSISENIDNFGNSDIDAARLHIMSERGCLPIVKVINVRQQKPENEK